MIFILNFSCFFSVLVSIQGGIEFFKKRNASGEIATDLRERFNKLKFLIAIFWRKAVENQAFLYHWIRLLLEVIDTDGKFYTPD